MNTNRRFILPAALVSLVLTGGMTGPGNASAATARTISVNFTASDGDRCALVRTSAFAGELIGYGEYAVRGSNWVDCTQCGASGSKPESLVTDLTLTDNKGDSSAYDGVNLYVCSAGHFYRANTVKDGNSQMLHAYLDDKNGDANKKAGFKLENLPFHRYTVLVYFNSDTDKIAIPAYEINGAFYKGTNGVTTAAAANETWGAPKNSTGLDLNKNTLIVTDLTGTLTVQSSTDATAIKNSSRGCISGFQVVEQKTPISWNGGDGLWSETNKWAAPWEDRADTVFPETGGTVGVDTNVIASSLEFNGDYTLTNANGSIALSGPVTVAENKTAAILAKISGALAKNGPGTIIVDPGLTQADSYSFSGPATVQNGQLSAPVTLAADAALTLKDATLGTTLAGNGASLALAGTNTLGTGAAIGRFSSTAFAAGSLTRIAGDVAFGGLGAVTAEAGSALAVADNANLTYDFALGASLPVFTKLDGTVKVTGALTPEQIAPGFSVPVAKVADGVSIEGKFSGGVTTSTGHPIGVAFTLGEGGIVRMSAVLDPAGLVYTKKTGEDAFTWTNGAAFDGGFTFKEFDNVTFQPGDSGEQAVAVNVPETVMAGDVTIDGAGFSFTGLPVSALSMVKKGGGAVSFPDGVVAGGAAAAGGSWEAGAMAAGTVAVSNGAVFRAKTLTRRTMRFLRLNFTEDWGEKRAAIAELRLFRKTGNGYEPIAWPAGTEVTDCENRHAVYNGENADPRFTRNTEGNGHTPDKLIDGIYHGSSPSSDDLNKWWPEMQLPTWVVVKFPAAIPAADGYNLCAADYYPRDPKAWTVEISPDGADGHWTTVDRQTEQAFGGKEWSNHDPDTRTGNVPAFFFDDPEAADVAVAADGTIVADGAWAARLTLASGATLKAETGRRLALHTAGASAQIPTDLKVDLSGYASTAAGSHYILTDDDTAGWPDVNGFTVTGGTLAKDSAGYYVDIPARRLAWTPGGQGGAINPGTWKTGFDEMPWTVEESAEPTFFRDNDNVAFGNLGDGRAVVNISGEVRPASAAFNASDETAYILEPAAGTGARLVLPGTGTLTVGGTVTNRAPCAVNGQTTLNGTLVLASAADAAQTFSGKISGQGNLVKDGEGTAEITAEIASKGTLAVNGGKLTINNENAGVTAITAAKDNPVFVGPGATLRFQGWGQKMLPNNAWLLCDGGRVEIKGTNPFPKDNLPVFTLTNRALLVADCSTGPNGHLHLKTINLNGSDILIAGNKGAYNNEGLTAVNMTIAGACGISYAPGAAQTMFKIKQGGEIDIAAGGSLLFAVKAGKDDFSKTGPGTLIATNGAAFLSALTVNEGALKLPQEAGIFEKAVTFADNAAIDVSARTNAFDWGAKLTVPGGYTVKVDVSGREVKVGEKLLTWDAKPAGDFQLIGANLSVTKGDKALEVISGGMVLILR